jgi:hypothetical protein
MVTYLDRVEDIRRLHVHPKLKGIDHDASYILSGHGIDVSKRLKKRRICFVR